MPLLTKRQLAAELGMLPTGIQALTRARKIPVLRLSSKTVRYDLDRVKEALAKFEIQAVG